MRDRGEAPADLVLDGVGAATEELSTAASPRAVAALLADVATALPGISGAAVFLVDRRDGDLREEASTVDRTGEPAEAVASVASDAYLDGEPVIRERQAENGDDSRTVAGRPLGGFGALVVASEPGVENRVDAALSVLVSVSRRRLERLECDRVLHQRTRERDDCAESLVSVEDVLDLIFGLQRAVSAAASQPELERIVCERIAAVERVAFAWIGRADTGETRVRPVAAAGHERGYLDAVDRTLVASNTEPAVVVAREREPTVVEDVGTGLQTASWRREAHARGVSSVRAVPLGGDGRFSGVLAVYTSDASAASDLWRRTLEHAAAIVTHGIRSLDRKRALLSDAVVEVELRLVGGDDVFGRVAHDAGVDLRLDGVATSDGSLVLFLATSDDGAASVESTLARDPAVVSVETARQDADYRFEVVVREEWLLSRFADAGATPQSVEATAAGTDVVLTLPANADVERLVASLERRYDRVVLRSRRERTRPVARERYLWAKLEESLTDRQLETLRTAYLDGYFEWPRESTGEEVAASLDISQPTFSRHLRTAERKLLSLVFTSELE